MGELLAAEPFGEVRACYHLPSGERRVAKVLTKSSLDADQTNMINHKIERLKDLEHHNL